MSAPLSNQSHRWPANPILVVKLLSPSQRRHIAIVVHRLIRHESKPLPQRRSHVRVSSTLQQQSSKLIIVPAVCPIRLRYYTAEERRLTSETIFVNRRLRIHIRPALQYPSCNLNLVEIHAHVQQRRTFQWSSVQRQRFVLVASQLARINLLMPKCPLEQFRITPQ